MTRTHRLTRIVAVAVVLAAGTAQAQKQIRLLATVTDPDGAPIETLAPADVRIEENGSPATVITAEAITRVPKLHLLIDNGVGIPSEAHADLRKGLRGLLEGVPPGVDISVVTTAPQPRFVERGTADREKALKAIDLVAPDSGAGRFIESLFEVGERIDRDKQESSNVVVSVATTAGDVRTRDSDVKKILERAGSGRMRVYVVLFTGRTNTTLSGGDTQQQIGDAAAKNSGGRFEQINSSSRLATLLPEIGAELSKTMGQGSKQFRFTADRPAGASGDLGRLSLGVTGKLVSGVTVAP